MAKSREQSEQLSWLPENAIRNRQNRLADRRDIFFFIRNILITLVLVFIVFFCVLGVHTVKNDNMAPRISVGDLLLYFRYDNTLAAPNIVIYQAEGKNLVGRIVARAGDEVNVVDNKLLVNGYIQNSANIFYETIALGGVEYPITLTGDEYFILADGRRNFPDSRCYGPINKRDIKGRVVMVLRRDNF